MNTIAIMRGIPGSGKSTWAKRNWPEARVCSADHFFTNRTTGDYEFDPARIGEAHNDCLRRFLGYLVAGHNYIVVDNTNLRVFEFAPYYRLAEMMGFGVQIVQINCDPQTAFERGRHGVPLDKIEAMWKSMEPIPHHWNAVCVNAPTDTDLYWEKS